MSSSSPPPFPTKSFKTLLKALLHPEQSLSPERPATLLTPQFAKSHPLVSASLNRVLYGSLRSLSLGWDDDGGGNCKQADPSLVSSTVQELEQLESYVFDRLNTGHWKSVDGGWREVYSVVCLLKLPFLNLQQHNTQSLLKTCDMALLMGSPIHDNILGRIAEELCDVLTAKTDRNNGIHNTTKTSKRLHINPENLIIRNKSQNEFQIQQLTRPSLEHFSNLMSTSTPAKLLGIVDHWPALRLWSVEYIREKAGPRSVPVELGPRYTAPDWTQTIMTINSFIDKFISKRAETAYIAQHNLFSQLPSLSPDIIPPDYTQFSPHPPEINAWFGPPNTISPTHHDPNHNILVQVFGTKVVRLFPPSESERLRPYPPGSLLFNTSSLDVEGEGLFEEVQGMRDAAHCDLVLEGGEALFIPRGWWHYVKSVGGCYGDDNDDDASFSVSFWFE